MRLTLLALSLPLLSVAAEIPQGSHTLLRLENAISTRTAQEGQYVYLRTAWPITADNHIVVPEGSYVVGVVARAVRPGRVKGKAELSIRIESLTLPSGKKIMVSPHLASVESGGSGQKVDPKEGQIKQEASHGTDAVRTATMAGSGAAIGAMVDRSVTGAAIGGGVGAGVGLASVLLSRGKEIDLPRGSTVDVVFERAVPIE
jgi:hypothetical protein